MMTAIEVGDYIGRVGARGRKSRAQELIGSGGLFYAFEVVSDGQWAFPLELSPCLLIDGGGFEV